MKDASSSKRSGAAKLALVLCGIAAVVVAILGRHHSSLGQTIAAAKPVHAVVAPGEVEGASPAVDLAFEASGVVAEVLVEEGSTVRRGERIAVLDAKQEQSQVTRAMAELDASRARLSLLRGAPVKDDVRMQEARIAAQRERVLQQESQLAREAKLGATGAIAQADLESAHAQTDIARADLQALESGLSLLRGGARAELRAEGEANVRIAEAELEYRQALLETTRLYAPFDGVVLRRFVDPGAHVAPNSALPALRVASRAQLYLRAEVDESDWSFVHIGQHGYAVPTTGPKVSGTIAKISPEFGTRRLGAEDPTAPRDTRVIEVMFALDDHLDVPLGLRMDLHLDAAP